MNHWKNGKKNLEFFRDENVEPNLKASVGFDAKGFLNDEEKEAVVEFTVWMAYQSNFIVILGSFSDEAKDL